MTSIVTKSSEGVGFQPSHRLKVCAIGKAEEIPSTTEAFRAAELGVPHKDAMLEGRVSKAAQLLN